MPLVLPKASPGSGPWMRTWHLFGGLCLVLLVANWYSREFVVTREVQEALFRGRLDPVGIERQWQIYQRMEAWSYVFTPLFLWIQIAFIALLVQLALLLGRVEVPFARLFRVAAVAQVASVAAIIAGLVHRAGLDPSKIAPGAYFQSPWILSEMLAGAATLLGPLAGLLAQVTVFDLVWYLLLLVGLERTAGVRRGAAVFVTLGLFACFNAFDWALTAYLARLGT